MKELASLDTVILNEWFIKASSMDGMICIVVYHPIFMWSQVRFFRTETSAHNWIEYLMLANEQGQVGDDDETAEY